MFAYVDLSVSLAAARHRLVLRDHVKVQLQMSIWKNDQIEWFGTTVFRKLDKETVEMKSPLCVPFALLDAPSNFFVVLKLVDSLGLHLDSGRCTVPQFKQTVHMRRQWTLDRAAIAVSFARAPQDRMVGKMLSASDAPGGALIAHDDTWSHVVPNLPLRITIHEIAAAKQVSSPAVSIVFRQVGISEQRARSDVIDKATLPQISRQFVFMLTSQQPSVAGVVILPGTITIVIFKQGLLSDELYARLELRLEDIAQAAIDKQADPAAAPAQLQQPAAGGLSYVKWHRVAGSRHVQKVLVQVLFPPNSLVVPPPRAVAAASSAVAAASSSTVAVAAASAPAADADDAVDETRSSTSSMKSAVEDGIEDFQMTPSPHIPTLSELSEFARSFYEAGGVKFENDAVYEHKIQAEAEEDTRRRVQLKRAQRRLSASGATLIDTHETPLTTSTSVRLSVPAHMATPPQVVRRTSVPDEHTASDADVRIRVPSSLRSSSSVRSPVLVESSDIDAIPSLTSSVSSIVLPPGSPAQWESCAACHEESDDIDAYVTQDFCPHHICVDCVLNAVVIAADSDRVVCPVEGCTGSTSNRILRQILPSDEFERRLDIELRATLKAVSADPSLRLVRCPAPGCDFVCETCDDSMAGVGDKDDNDNDSDDDDQVGGDEGVSVASAERYRQRHRFRCRKCFVDFCDRCRRTPYHDGHTCKSLVAYEAAPKCRFCGERVLAAGADGAHVCKNDDCQAKQRVACTHVHSCSHSCGGLRFETTHLPCLDEECDEGEAARTKAKVSQTAQDFCNICWVDPLCGAPALQLACGHLFHLSCAQRRVHERWGNARITFAFTGCPLCHVTMEHPALTRSLRMVGKLREQIERMAMQRLAHEGLEKDPEIVEGRFKDNALGFAMNRFAYYECFKCKLPYFGGQAQCAGGPGENEEGQFDPKLLVCGSCASGGAARGGDTNCAMHGNDFIDYKCKFCCNIATWFCWGTTHLCEDCHKTQNADYAGTKMTRRPVSDFPQHYSFSTANGNDSAKWPTLAKCPLGRKHSPNGTEELSLGCQLCRQVKEF